MQFCIFVWAAKEKLEGWGCSSVVEHVLTINLAVGSVPSTNKQTKKPEKVECLENFFLIEMAQDSRAAE